MTPKDPIRALPPDERMELVRLLQQYLRDNFDLDPGDLGAELLLVRAGELVGPLYWNRALGEAAILVRDYAERAEADLLANHVEVERRQPGGE